ncbi:flagellar assembly protein FliW [Paenibacillus sp. HJL G12]|uniref:Flagellar assembly factor FliW n=1 Tax=Paenibacillus dendrobii TaxID=2691084 RepID=A0A7X3IMB6_9BACL|nr:flagellar assembly protein FliW [Paenibacillus dendrobii]MWV46608.1 flagellar assembly protein FliW [Paenibacillus dendrobii]
MHVPNMENEEVRVKEEVFEFKNGIPGFEQYNRYMIQSHDEYFSILQSVENEGVAFIITNPFIFFNEYEFELSDNDQELLGITNIKDVVVRSIVTWGDDPTKTTTNLMAPIILNVQNKRGRQVVLYPTPYNSKHPLLIQDSGKKGGEE